MKKIQIGIEGGHLMSDIVYFDMTEKPTDMPNMMWNHWLLDPCPVCHKPRHLCRVIPMKTEN